MERRTSARWSSISWRGASSATEACTRWTVERREMDLRKRILIIEDDDDIALSLKYNLEKEGGYVVATAGDGDAGLRAASQRPPDLVILDLNLPGMDGLSLCKAIRPGAATSNV